MIESRDYQFLEGLGFDADDSAFLRDVLQVPARNQGPAGGDPIAHVDSNNRHPVVIPVPVVTVQPSYPVPTPAPAPVAQPIVPPVPPTNTIRRLAVNDRVIFSGAEVGVDFDAGPLRAGDIGTVLFDDRSNQPYQVRADTGLQQGSVWYYSEAALRVATAQEIAAATAAFGQRRSFAVGSRVRIQKVPESEVEFRQQGHHIFTSDMVLMMGKCGVIVSVTPREYYEVRVDGFERIREWSAFMLETAAEVPAPATIPASASIPAPAPATTTNSNTLAGTMANRLQVGDRVTVTQNYASMDDAANGPLRAGDAGEIIKDDYSLKPFQVRADKHGTTWWYVEGALQKSTVPANISNPSNNDYLTNSNSNVAPRPKFKVGDRVCLADNYVAMDSGGDAHRGVLQPGDIGEILVDDNSSKPYHVRGLKDGRTYWYCAEVLMVAPANATVTPAPAASSSRFKVRDRVTLVSNYASIEDAAGGPMTLGDIGVVEQDDGSNSKPFQVNFNGRKWWYEQRALVLATGNTVVHAPPSGRLKVNDRVCLSPNYRSYGDAAEGPLQPGQEGVVVQDDQSSKPFKVRADHNDKMWWYVEGALMLASATTRAAAPVSAPSPAPVAPINARFSIGNQVQICNRSVNEVMSLQTGHGGYKSDMTQCLNTIGVVTRVDADGDCEVAGVGVHVWNPALLELVQPRLSVGDFVTVVVNYSSVSDSASGPLKSGDEGVLICDDNSDKPYQVRSLKEDGKTWWYDIKALRKAR
jgi:hypothetical protein